jgi:hypothetical protein
MIACVPEGSVGYVSSLMTSQLMVVKQYYVADATIFGQKNRMLAVERRL